MNIRTYWACPPNCASSERHMVMQCLFIACSYGLYLKLGCIVCISGHGQLYVCSASKGTKFSDLSVMIIKIRNYIFLQLSFFPFKSHMELFSRLKNMFAGVGKYVYTCMQQKQTNHRLYELKFDINIWVKSSKTYVFLRLLEDIFIY